jgi:hypothetical protein
VAYAQQAAAPATPAAPAAERSPSSADSDAKRKSEILASDCWRRAMFELNEWLRVQSVYPPEEVARIKADFAARVERMSAPELQLVLEDLETKFRILDTQEAREIRAWLGNYLALLTDRGREGVMRMIPDFATMNSAQLQQTLARLGQYRDARARQGTQKQQLRSTARNPWNQQPAPASRPAARTAYRSPYRPPSFERPFENVNVGQQRRTSIDPEGRVWLHLGF